MILSVDPGVASLGYAVGDECFLVDTGTLRTKAGQSLDDRITYLLNELDDLIKEHFVYYVLIEQYRIYRNTLKSLHATIEFIGAFKERIRRLSFSRPGLGYTEIPYRSWNSWFRKVKLDEIPKPYRDVLESKRGSEHQRDAVKMLIGYLFGRPEKSKKEVVA